MSQILSRREFLKLSGLSFSALAYRSIFPITSFSSNDEPAFSEMAGRVTRRTVTVYSMPDLNSPRLRKVIRDEILPLIEEVRSPYGPNHNPIWFRLADGYIHSAYLQRVEGAHLNAPLMSIPAGGLLGEITVPYSQTTYQKRNGEWISLYRLYYQSVHWIVGIIERPEGKPWYALADDWLKVKYFVPAEHVRAILPDEYSLLSPAIPSIEKRIEVSLDEQRLTAFEGDRIALQTSISSGLPYMETPKGNFQVTGKFLSKHMGDGGLTNDINAYELVGVPYATFFHPAGIAFHGTFWHNNFGTPMSKGCINLRNDDARFLFRWSTPAFDPEIKGLLRWKLPGLKTQVHIF